MLRFFIALSLLCTTSLALAAPEAKLWPRWQAHDAQSTDAIDQTIYNQFLKKYVVVHQDGPNGVRYSDVSAAGRKKLESYIEAMEKLRISRYNRHVQRAYWMNLYNAETLDLVLDAYPVDSIKDVKGGFFNRGPWDKKVLTVDGVKLSLNDIEHRILRPIWPDGMTHYGVNCASVSCPSLRATAFTGANVDQALRDNATDYINSPEGVSISRDNQVTVSKIYDWYQADFGGDIAGVISHLRQFAAPALSARLDSLHRIDGYAYDWSLNSESNVEKKAQR
ncbi:MAG: DUF547 domain-containing protein [Salinisphaera sp.]|jgi:hypothetical protein|nr:DUF547 domain-containing protein [Salinisphaera sp.]